MAFGGFGDFDEFGYSDVGSVSDVTSTLGGGGGGFLSSIGGIAGTVLGMVTGGPLGMALGGVVSAVAGPVMGTVAGLVGSVINPPSPGVTLAEMPADQIPLMPPPGVGEGTEIVLPSGEVVRFDMQEWKIFFDETAPGRVRNALQARFDRAGNLLAHAMQARVPVDTGKLKASINCVPVSGGLGVEVGSDLKYAIAVEYGTGPHWVPLDALVGWADRHGINPWLVQRAIADHGTEAQPYIYPAWQENEGTVQDILTGVWGQVIGD